MMELTVKEYAAVERVSERTVWTWISKGAVDVRRTPGGGVRIRSARVVMMTLSDDMKNTEVSGSLSR